MTFTTNRLPSMTNRLTSRNRSPRLTRGSAQPRNRNHPFRMECPAADAAVERGRAALLEARREQATARAAALQENSAFEREQSEETILARSELRIASLLSRLVVGLDLLGLRADESDLGAPAAARAQRLLAAVLLMERAYRGQEIGAARPALLQAESSGDPQLEMLSRLALARAAEG